MNVIFGVVLIVGMQAAEVAGREIGEFYQRLDGALIDRSMEDLISLMEHTESINVISFGGGLGPTDRSFLRYNLVRSAWPILSEANSSDSSTDEWTNRVLSAIRLTSDDFASLSAILDSKDASLRWIALKHIDSVDQSPPPSILAKLRNIAISDPFIIISRRQVPSRDNRPPPPGLTVNRFSAPLRELASGILGEPPDSVPSSEVDKAGLTMLLEYSERDPSTATGVRESIKLLDPSQPLVRWAQEEMEATDSLRELLSALKNGSSADLQPAIEDRQD